MPKTPEGYILDAALEWLAAKHILAYRMNTGAVKTENRFFRFGVPGMADILAFPWYEGTCHCGTLHRQIHPTWIEVKAHKGKQSELQKSFQRQVEAEGHRYIIVRSIEDLESFLGR